MYSTVSGNCKDNSSVYSGSSATTGSSAAGFGRNRRLIPRSNSTSDLYEIPSAGSGGSRKKKLLHTSSFNQASSVGDSTGSRMGPRAQSWTSKNSGQLSFWASNAAGTDPYLPSTQPVNLRQSPYHIPHYKQQQQTARQGLYKSGSRSNSSYSLEPKNSLNSIPERRQPNYVLTPYQLQRKQMKDSFQFPNGENFTPRSRLGSSIPRSSSSTTLDTTGGTRLQTLSRSQSMNSLPVKSVKHQKYAKPPTAVSLAYTSPVESGSSDSSYNSMRDHSSSGSTNLSSGPSAHSSNTALPLVVEGKSQDTLAKKLRDPSELGRSISPTDQAVAARSGRPNPAHATLNGKKRAPIVPARAQEVVPRDFQKEQASSIKKQPGSGTKLGAFFKKIFSLSSNSSPAPSSSASPRSSSTSLVSLSQLSPLNLSRRKKRKRMDADILSPTINTGRPGESCVVSQPKLEISSVKGKNEDKVERGGGSEEVVESYITTEDDDNEEDSDDILMDTDLVFDSLLLKADASRSSSQQKQIELRQKLMNQSQSDSASVAEQISSVSGQKPKETESTIDYELISEFSRLGTFIQDSSRLSNSELANLPPRSAKRPTLADKELARSFYHPLNDETDFGHHLIKRLCRTWKVVHIDEASNQLDENFATEEKRLRFADEIYVNDTWSQFDYQRSDKRFIKNRRRMMQLENEGFIRAIKVELNEYKRNEMAVHQESVRFTHLFL